MGWVWEWDLWDGSQLLPALVYPNVAWTWCDFSHGCKTRKGCSTNCPSLMSQQLDTVPSNTTIHALEFIVMIKFWIHTSVLLLYTELWPRISDATRTMHNCWTYFPDLKAVHIDIMITMGYHDIPWSHSPRCSCADVQLSTKCVYEGTSVGYTNLRLRLLWGFWEGWSAFLCFLVKFLVFHASPTILTDLQNNN